VQLRKREEGYSAEIKCFVQETDTISIHLTGEEVLAVGFE